MGKYIDFKIAGYWIYYTSHCLNEGIIHIHATDKGKLTEGDSAKLWVYKDGRSKVEKIGRLNKKELIEIQEWVKNNIDLIESEWLKNNMGGSFKIK